MTVAQIFLPILVVLVWIPIVIAFFAYMNKKNR